MGSGKTKKHESFVVAPAHSIKTLVGAVPDDFVLPEDTPPADTQSDVVPAAVDVPVFAGVGDDAVTPIPDELAVGDPNGHGLLVGGDDLVDSTVTLHAYASADGERIVLSGWLEPGAETKMLESMTLDEEQFVPVEVTKTVDGRLPLDEHHELYDQLETVAKSVNHHLKAQDGIPDHTHANISKLYDTLDTLAADAPDADQDMIGAYQDGLAKVSAAITGELPYHEGGKVPHLEPVAVSQTVTVTEMLPAPADMVDGKLAAQIRDATRIAPTLDGGAVSWDGKTRQAANGVEYAVDLGDGYEAIYRPYTAAGDHADPVFAQRGAIEIVAPPGASPADVVGRLGDVNVASRPLTYDEAEYAYLRRNVWAQQLDRYKPVRDAFDEAATFVDAKAHQIAGERLTETAGLSPSQTRAWAQAIQREAETAVLSDKVRHVRDAVAKRVGLPDGEALSSLPGYQPTPTRTGGWFTFGRFDVTTNTSEVSAAFAKTGRNLTHTVTGHNLVEIFENGGVLTAGERRHQMGLKPMGKSPAADAHSGGSRSVFLQSSSYSETGLVWHDPARLLARSDWYAYSGDHYGSLNKESGHSLNGQTRNPLAVADHHGGNEIMFANGIDLLGADGPSRINCDAVTRNKILKICAARGITEIAGRPVEEVIK